MNIFTILKQKRESILLVAISIFISLGLLQQVINVSDIVPFHDWDEAIYAQVAKELYNQPKILLTYNGESWFEKPPLPSFLYAISRNFPIKTETSARLVSFLFSLISLFTIYKIMKKLGISIHYIALTLLVCVASPMFRDRSLLVNVDIMLTAGWLIYIAGLVHENSLPKFIGLVIGVFSKSLLGFIPFFIDITIHIFSKKVTVSKVAEWVFILFSASLWHIYMILMYGKPFIQSHFLDHLVARITRPIELHFGDKWYYLARLWEQTNVFMIFAIIASAFIIYQVVEKYKKSSKLSDIPTYELQIVLTPVVYFALLTLSKSKLHWYITPIIPFVAILTGLGFARLNAYKIPKLVSITSRLLQAVIVIYCMFTFVQSVNYIQPDWYSPTDKTIIGQCIGNSKMQGDNITYLVPSQERKDAHVIEAANLQIGSSFIYGSAPAFLYYANPPVQFVYKEELLKENLDRSNIFVTAKNDLNSKRIYKDFVNWGGNSKPFCETTTLSAYRKP